MNRRIQSIDAVRGLSIIGMVLCSAYTVSSGMPAWMFHCQVPPPECVFKPEIRGITWVDLVFPFFLFSMGAAFPFSLGNKMERGVSCWRLVRGLVKRWLTLSLFALALGNAYGIYSSDAPDLMKGLFSIGVFMGFFLSLVRTAKTWVNPVGWLLTAGMFVAEHFVYKVPLNLHNTDVIIMIMACVSIAGGVIWLLTKSSHSARWIIFAMVLVVRAITYHSDALDCMAMPHCISWLVDWGYFQYLAIVIPASVVGDWILKWTKEGRSSGIGPTWKACILPLVVVLQLWGLYSRNVAADFILTAALAIIYVLLTFKQTGLDRIIAYTGFALLAAGIACDPLDGGIAKDYCNVSYLLTTGGMAALVTSFFLTLEGTGSKLPVLSLCGQNPMLAYTVNGFLISPLLYACGLLSLLDTLSNGCILWGMGRALLVTALMCAATCIFSKHEIYWRS